MSCRWGLAVVSLVCLVTSGGAARAQSGDGEPAEDEPARPWFPDGEPAPPAAARPDPPAWVTKSDEKKRRAGFFISVGLGGGILAGVDGETAAASGLDARFGLMLTPRVGLAADIFAAARTREPFGEAVYMFSSIGPSVTYWFSSRLWAVAGVSAVGLFRRPTDDAPASESGGAGVHALIGFECLRTSSGNGVLNLQVRLFGGVPNQDDDVGGVLLLLGGAGFGMMGDD